MSTRSETQIVLDACNAVAARDGPDIADEAEQNGIGITSQKYLPGTRLVRAFNALNYKCRLENSEQAYWPAGADGVPNIIAGAPGGIDTPAQWLSFSYVRFASASARRFLTSRFRRIPFLITSDLSAFDNFRIVFLAFFIANALAFWSRQPVLLCVPPALQRLFGARQGKRKAPRTYAA